MTKKRLFEVLREILKNSRLSDRQIARRLACSQPTITRTRKHLEEQGYIKSYTVVPDFAKMGYQILAFTFFRMKSYPSAREAEEIVRRASEWVGNRNNVVFAADGQGLRGKDVVVMSFHKNYPEYADFMRSLAVDWSQMVTDFESFMVSIGTGYKMKPLDLKYLAYDE